MEKLLLPGKCVNPNTSYSMDELCNFEAHRLYASIDMHQDAAIEPTKKAALGNNHDDRSLVQDEQTEGYVTLGCVDSVMREDVSVDLEPLPETKGNISKCSWRSMNNTVSASSSSPKKEGLQPWSGSPASQGPSSATGYSGSVLMEDDIEDCDSGVSSHGVDLMNGRQFEDFVPENIFMCINAGGAPISGTSFGADFLEDRHFVGGDVLQTGESILNSKDPLIYQTARYGNFSYIIEELPPGDYLVDLHFAEIIFTNGPPGLRVFDVLIQDRKIVTKLDVYAMVGSNTPLVIMNARAIVKEKNLSISFRAITGSPTLNGICIKKGLRQESIQNSTFLCSNLAVDVATPHKFVEKDEDSMEKPEVNAVKPLEPQLGIHQARMQKCKSKARKCLREYELKIRELKDEVHQAWMSVQDANQQNEKLQIELDCRSLHVESLAQAVERQLFDLKDVQDQAANEKTKWVTVLLQIDTKFQSLKQDYNMLAKEAHEWVSSFPAIQSMTDKLQALMDELEGLKRKFVKQGQDLRLYYNQVLELKGNIRVFCRCRPLSIAEVSAGASSIVDFDSTHENELFIRTTGARKVFKFDRIFTPSNSQSDVFMDTAPVVVSVLDGYNVCIFAYGQTGTGKTFTMEGTENDRGVNYRTLEELFNLASERKGQYEYVISVSVVEVYNEQIRDLLAQPLAPGQSAKKLEIKQVGEGVHHVPGLTEATVQSMEEVWDVLKTGSSARAVGATNVNEHSSRSHCMLCVMVKGECLLTGECTRSKLWLVDLAGSERVAKTDVQGERLKEAQNINKSLSALGDVIFALATKSSHVPYRNSKLTHLLQDSLGGEAKTLMFVQISPSELDAAETLCSLNFASRVRGVELGPARKQADSTEIVKYRQMVEKLKQDVRAKDEVVRKNEDCLKRLEDNLRMKDQAYKALADKFKELEGVIAIEKKGRSSADTKLKEQQRLLEQVKDQQACMAKLREELKFKDSCIASMESAGQKRAMLQELAGRAPLKENHVLQEEMKVAHASSKEVCQARIPQGNDLNAAKVAAADTSPTKVKMVQSKYLESSPVIKNAPARKPGRNSLSGVQRKRASMAVLTAQPYKTDIIDGVRTSSESLNDSFPDENALPHLQQSLAPIQSSPKSAGWKKGTAIAPSTVLRRSIPRKIHFKSPHLQPGYVKAAQTLSPTLMDLSHPGSRIRAAERVLAAQNKTDGERQGLSKMRRGSMATACGRPPLVQHQQPWNASTMATATTLPQAGTNVGGAQRVPISNRTASNRERGWNR